ncbi:MAG: hypothetical protein GX766_02065 [Firmicutes bacterium]|nr:hypothetical protein [Bacillota bacterium]HOB21405.1 hypothetical protein [Bacillota bacterium]HQD40888.1 hypothetical protein [Bacillota bacterium]
MNTKKILSILNNLQVQNLDSGLLLLEKPQTKVSSFTESLQAGSVMVREKEGLLTVANKGYEPVLLLAGETLIGSWQIKASLLGPPQREIHIPPDYLVERQENQTTCQDLRCLPWQVGCIGVASGAALDIIPMQRLAAQMWPLLVAKHQQYLKKQLKPEVDLFGQLETIKIKPCPTVGSGKAFSLQGKSLAGRALIFDNQLIHLQIAKTGD